MRILWVRGWNKHLEVRHKYVGRRGPVIETFTMEKNEASGDFISYYDFWRGGVGGPHFLDTHRGDLVMATLADSRRRILNGEGVPT